MSVLNTRIENPERGESIAVPAATFARVEDICRKVYGFKLFTVLQHRPESGEIERVYSSNPQDYPVGGRKPMGPTPWGAIVLDAQRAWLGNGAQDIEWAFPDSKLLAQLGCDCCACAPIVSAGRTVGVVSISDAVDRYAVGDLEALSLIASLLAGEDGTLTGGA